MARVTDQQVKELMPDVTQDTTPFIRMASVIVSEDLAGQGMSSDRLELIELNLAAHFTAISVEKGGLRVTSAGGARDVYAGDFTSRFSLTRFGQQAMAMDSSGKLQALDKPSARFTVV